MPAEPTTAGRTSPEPDSCLRQRVKSFGWFIPSTATGSPGPPVDHQQIVGLRAACLDRQLLVAVTTTGELDLDAVLVGPEIGGPKWRREGFAEHCGHHDGRPVP